MRSIYSFTLSVCVVALGSIGVTHAANFPAKTIKIVVPFTPGGAVDSVARILAEELTKQEDTNVIVENKPGAGGAIGVSNVTKAKADGYTLLLGSIGPITINPSLYDDLPYSVSDELAPIALLANTPLLIASQPNGDIKNIDDLIRALEEEPESKTYGSAGVGNITHLATEYFLDSVNVKAVHVPYQGSAPAIADFLGGRLDFIFDVVPTATPYVKDGQYQPLAVTTSKRSDAIPDVPTLEELGHGPFDVSSWFGIFAPSATPDEILEKLNEMTNTALKSEEVQNKLKSMGYNAVGGSQDSFKEFVESETSRWAKVVNDVGAQQD